MEKLERIIEYISKSVLYIFFGLLGCFSLYALIHNVLVTLKIIEVYENGLSEIVFLTVMIIIGRIKYLQLVRKIEDIRDRRNRKGIERILRLAEKKEMKIKRILNDLENRKFNWYYYSKEQEIEDEQQYKKYQEKLDSIRRGISFLELLIDEEI